MAPEQTCMLKRPLAAEPDFGAPVAAATPLRRRIDVAVSSPAKRAFAESSRRPPLTVGELMRRRRTVVCGARSTLADIVDRIMLHDRTAAAVVGSAGELLGVITENDVMRAYALGASPTCCASDWLSMHLALLPKDVVDALTVRPTCCLSEAAAALHGQGSEGCSACRHLVVREEDGHLLGVLSALDLARALCSTYTREEQVRKVGRSLVKEIMKPRSMALKCKPNVTLQQVLEEMSASQQNCMLVTDGGVGVSSLLGVVTPRDAMRAFVEHVPMSVEVGRWLQGVQSDWGPRAVEWDEPVQDCAAKMVEAGVHHLVVVSPSGVAGVVSSTDLAQAIGSAERAVEGCELAGKMEL
mmetsp:Transcript_74213/g.215010  ORF Transcript_74213/g.215010 Transcript_74213/m.215010 type:complete len:355 (+) Transcript_74213:81-1145(+)